MGGHAHQINGQHIHVDLDSARSLRGIHVQQDAFFAAQRTNGRNVLDHADFVVHEQDADQDGVGTNGSLQGIHVHQSIFLDIQVSHIKALALQLAHGVQHGLVFGLEGDEVLALALVEVGSALQGQVDGLSGTAGPDDFAGVCTNQIGHLHTRLLNRLFSFPAPGVAAGCRVAKVLAQPWDHGIHNAWIDRSGGAVIEINGEMRGHVHGWLSKSFWLATKSYAIKIVQGAAGPRTETGGNQLRILRTRYPVQRPSWVRSRGWA